MELGGKVVEYIGTPPTLEELDAFLAPPNPFNPANLDELEKAVRALALVQRDWSNMLKAEVRGLAVLLVNKGLITSAEANALKAYDGTGVNDSMTVQDLKDAYAAKYASLP
jgi:hypothetical protein